MALKFISRIVDISFKDIIAKRCIQALDLGKCLNFLTLIVGLYGLCFRLRGKLPEFAMMFSFLLMCDTHTRGNKGKVNILVG